MVERDGCGPLQPTITGTEDGKPGEFSVSLDIACEPVARVPRVVREDFLGSRHSLFFQFYSRTWLCYEDLAIVHDCYCCEMMLRVIF